LHNGNQTIDAVRVSALFMKLCLVLTDVAVAILARREPTQNENSATVGTDLSKVEAADLLNRLKTRRKKSRADLVDVETMLGILGA